MIPNSSPVATSASAKCSATSRITAAENTNIATTEIAAVRLRERPHEACRSDQVRLLGRRPGDPDRVEHEDRHEDERVDQRDRVLQGQRQRVDGRDRQERDLDGVGALELDRSEHRRPVPRPEEGDEHDHRPADADQEPVGAGHVREREGARALAGVAGRLAGLAELRERLAALEREHHVDGVLGQDRDEREHGDRQPGRDVELRGLRGPRQDERGAHDREPEEQRVETAPDVDVRETQHEPRDRDADREDDPEPLAERMDVLQLVAELGHEGRT